jgi:hypothetical protein
MVGIRGRAIVRLRAIGLSPSQLVWLDVSDVSHEAELIQGEAAQSPERKRIPG